MNTINDTNSVNGRHKSPHRFGLNAGSASILLIFVILCLVSFAVLSIVSANADRRLSEKLLAGTTAYYEACNQAEKALSATDRTLVSLYESSTSQEEYFKAVGHSKSYAIPISDVQTLEVSIQILYPTEKGDSYYDITAWQVLTTGEFPYESTLPVPK